MSCQVFDFFKIIPINRFFLYCISEELESMKDWANQWNTLIPATKEEYKQKAKQQKTEGQVKPNVFLKKIWQLVMYSQSVPISRATTYVITRGYSNYVCRVFPHFDRCTVSIVILNTTGPEIFTSYLCIKIYAYSTHLNNN